MAKSLLLCFALATTACVSADDTEPTAEATRSLDGAPGVEWYYTCSNDLLACGDGYGGVEFVLHTEQCGDVFRVRCQWGAANP